MNVTKKWSIIASLIAMVFIATTMITHAALKAPYYGQGVRIQTEVPSNWPTSVLHFEIRVHLGPTGEEMYYGIHRMIPTQAGKETEISTVWTLPSSTFDVPIYCIVTTYAVDETNLMASVFNVGHITEGNITLKDDSFISFNEPPLKMYADIIPSTGSVPQVINLRFELPHPG